MCHQPPPVWVLLLLALSGVPASSLKQELREEDLPPFRSKDSGSPPPVEDEVKKESQLSSSSVHHHIDSVGGVAPLEEGKNDVFHHSSSSSSASLAFVSTRGKNGTATVRRKPHGVAPPRKQLSNIFILHSFIRCKEASLLS